MSAFELKKTVSQFCYRTEPKPGGGFIARPSDPSMETFEGATGQEVQQKVLGAITAALSQNGAVRILPANLANVKLANVKFERSKIFWPAIVVIVAVVVILYRLFR